MASWQKCNQQRCIMRPRAANSIAELWSDPDARSVAREARETLVENGDLRAPTPNGDTSAGVERVVRGFEPPEDIAPDWG